MFGRWAGQSETDFVYLAGRFFLCGGQGLPWSAHPGECRDPDRMAL